MYRPAIFQLIIAYMRYDLFETNFLGHGEVAEVVFVINLLGDIYSKRH